MFKNGYSLIDTDGREIQDWGGGLPPNVVQLPNGDNVHCAEVGGTYGNWRLVERWLVDSSPSDLHTVIGRTAKFDGEKIIITVNYAPPTDAAIAANLHQQAIDALVSSDLVAIRCFKSGIPFPPPWQDFVKKLRSIARTGIGTIPATPAYPIDS